MRQSLVPTQLLNARSLRRFGYACVLLFAVFLSALAKAEFVENPTRHFSTTERFSTEAAALARCQAFSSTYGANPESACYRYGASATGQFHFSSGYHQYPLTGPSDQKNFYAGTFKYCPVGWEYFASDDRCATVVEARDDSSPRENGPPCVSCENPRKAPQPQLGEPINPATGNMWHLETDYAGATAHLSVARTYNSSRARPHNPRGNLFGTAWTSAFDVALFPARPFNRNVWNGCRRRTDTNELLCPPVPEDASYANPQAVVIIRAGGSELAFNRLSALEWQSHSDNNDHLVPTILDETITGWTLTVAGTGEVELFDAEGRLLSRTSRAGRVLRFTYSTGIGDASIERLPQDAPACTVTSQLIAARGKLLCVTDDLGRQINFEYNALGLVAKVTDPAGSDYLYAYDGPSGGCTTGIGNNIYACNARNLTSVTFPDSKTKTYHYNEKTRINSGATCSGALSTGTGYVHLTNVMTGLTDENAARHISWTYDCTGKATSSELAGGVEKVVLSYTSKSATGTSQTSVVRSYGNPAAPQTHVSHFGNKEILGVTKNLSVSSSCPQCGPFKTRTYDANGNDLSGTDWEGTVTTFNYDLKRNLQLSRIEAAGTPQARTVSTVWHPTLRLRMTSAEPKRITKYTYDSRGNILTRSIQATTDANGSQGIAATPVGVPRTWTYTYNHKGQVLIVDGPRTDVSDTTSYTYDASSGELLTVTNAVGHTTTIGEYDVHGRPGRIIASDGVTQLSYTTRGQLSSRIVTAGGISFTTIYEYDGAGLLKTVTQADGTVTTMTYDDAHRLTGVIDSLGNTMSYQLDLLGNRIAERAKDPNEVLARQITRAFNEVGNVIKVTGGAE